MLHNKFYAFVVCSLFVFALGFSANLNAADDIPFSSVIVNLPGTPIAITKFEAEFSGPSLISDESMIDYEWTLQNNGNKKVVAYAISVVNFDVFNEYLSRAGFYVVEGLDPKKAVEKTGTHTCYLMDTFLTGVAYISKVRFEDGSVWKADINALIKELKKIEKDFDSVLLKGKDVLPPSK